jgi:D-alanine-D-alanine ligase
MLQTPDGRSINTVAAIVDGYSRERYLDSAPWIIEALTKLGVGVELFRLTDSRMPMRLLGFSPDVVWPMSLGAYAEDGKLQGFIETLLPGTPYVGSGVAASALGMDKEYTQDACRVLGLTVPESACFQVQWHPHGRTCRVSKPDDTLFLTKAQQPNYPVLCEYLDTPLVVKPARGGASLDLAVVSTEAAFEDAFTAAGRLGPVLVQQYIAGEEYAVCLLDSPETRAWPVCQIVAEGPHTTEGKISGTFYRIPAAISDDLADQMRRISWALFDYLGCHGFARLDLKVDREGRIIPLEINTNPGLIPGVCIFPKVADLSYPHLIKRLLLTAFQPRQREVPRLAADQAAPFPEAFRSLLPALPTELQPPVYHTLGVPVQAVQPWPILKHVC